MKLWRFFNENDLLTTEEQKIKEKQDRMSFRFWIVLTIIVCICLLLI